MINNLVTKAVAATRRTFGEWLKERGANRDTGGSTLFDSLHYLLVEYEEPNPFSLPVAYKSELGRPVKRQVVRLASAHRSKPLRLDLTFPEGDRRALPAVLVSPGLGARPQATTYLEDHLASHGYLVVRLTHPGSNFWGATWRTPLGAFTPREFQRRIAELEEAVEAVLNGSLGWDTRDGEIALLGHSFGALTTAMLCGWQTTPARPTSCFSIGAYVSISPYGDSYPIRRLGIDPASFKELRPPTLFISGTNDNLFTLGRGAITHLEPYLACRRESNRHLLVGKTRHGHFSRMTGTIPRHTKLMVTSTVTAHLDAHLKNDPEAKLYLDRSLPLVACQHRSWCL